MLQPEAYVAKEGSELHHPFMTLARSLGWSRIEAVRVLLVDASEAERPHTGILLSVVDQPLTRCA